MSGHVKKICFLIADGFSLLTLTSSITPLKLANRILGHDAYTWQFVSMNGGVVVSDCGVPVSTDSAGPIRDTLVGRELLLAVIGGDRMEDVANRAAIALVRRALVSGAEVAGIAFGALLLAETGMLSGRRCAVHWEIAPAAIERFPEVTISCAYHTTDGRVHTCAGEAASFDLFLEIVAADFGRVLSDQINDAALNGEPRGEAELQPYARFRRLERIDSALLPILTYMEENVANPISMKDLTRMVALSRRQIERLFHDQLGEPPMKHFVRIRLERARSLLMHTGIPIVEVAVAVGYVSQSHFTKSFKNVYGCTPGEVRLRSNGTSRSRPCSKEVGFGLRAA